MASVPQPAPVPATPVTRPATGRTPLRKAALDRSLAALGMVLSSPVVLAAGAAIRLEDGPPVFFSQERAGRHGAPFQVWKFRSMRLNDLDPHTMGRVVGDHPLVTRTGRLLRRLKLDELPQLVNVAKGEMSLVGPRPALVSQLADYDEFQARRLDMPPGLTGWAQVNGGTALSWDERLLLDVWYVDNWSFRLDLWCLLRTVWTVLRGERVRASAVASAREHEHEVRAGQA
jgi:lipopolysaccharide/colanic/teichoic acid biosynthesis glycosyltransferase